MRKTAKNPNTPPIISLLIQAFFFNFYYNLLESFSN